MTGRRTYAVWLGGALAVLAVVLGVVLVAGRPPATSAWSAEPGDAVVFVGTGGVTWSDVSPEATPTLWAVLREGSTASLTVRSVRTTTCPVDGWLTLSAGQRAGAPDVAAASGRGSDNRAPCAALPDSVSGGTDGRGGTVPGWSTYLTAAADKSFGARIGLLGDQVAAAGECVQAIGPGAALGAARSDGTVDRWAAYSSAHVADLTGDCPLTMVDVGSVRDPDEVRAEDAVQPTTTRAEQVAAVDARLAEVLAAVPDGSTVLLGSISDAGNVERLRLAAMTGDQVPPGFLVSLSTRQPGLVQTADLTATVLARMGLPEAAGVSGRPLQTSPDGDAAEATSDAAAQDRLDTLVDYDLASHEVHALVPPFFNGLVIAQLVIYGFVSVVWRRQWGRAAQRLRLLRVTRRVAVVAATVPVATFLANLLPWWRFGEPMLAITAAVVLFVAVLSALALLAPWRSWELAPTAVVAATTMLVLALDVMTGSRLQLSSLMGLQPVVGGRFYGMGNVTFALFATATLLLCTAAADLLLRRGRSRGRAAAAVALIGLAGVAVDANPSWGADFGGPPALLPALAYLVLAVLGVRLTWRRGLLIVGGTAVFLVLLGVLDWLRPADSRSHLGDFVQSVIDGGAWDIVWRKAQQNLTILTGSWLTLLVPVGLVFVVVVLARPTSWGARALVLAFDRTPVLRPGLVAVLVMAVIGFALNDSGTAIPAVSATLALPLVIALCVQALLGEHRDDGAAPATPRQPSSAARRTAPGTDASPG